MDIQNKSIEKEEMKEAAAGQQDVYDSINRKNWARSVIEQIKPIETL